MKTKFKGWYAMPDAFRGHLQSIDQLFYDMKDYGLWRGGPGDYEKDAFCIYRTRMTIHVETVHKIARFIITHPDIKIAIFPIGMHMLDIVFYKRDGFM